MVDHAEVERLARAVVEAYGYSGDMACGLYDGIRTFMRQFRDDFPVGYQFLEDAFFPLDRMGSPYFYEKTAPWVIVKMQVIERAKYRLRRKR